MKHRIRRVDKDNIVLEKKRTGKKGQDIWITLGYYGAPIGLAKALTNLCLVGDDLTEFIELTSKKIEKQDIELEV